MSDNNIYDWYHEEYGFRSYTRQHLILTYKIDKSNLANVINNKRRAEDGWMLVSTYSNEQTLTDVSKFYLNRLTLAKAYRFYLSESVLNKVIEGKNWIKDLEVSSEFGPILREYCPRC